MGKYLRVCSYSAINSRLPSLSGGLECIVFKELWNWVTFETTEGEKLRKRGGASTAAFCVKRGGRSAHLFPCAFGGFGTGRVTSVLQ